MDYSPAERMARLWALVRQDPDCTACQTEMEEATRRLEARTDHLEREAHDGYWELPVCTHTFFGRVLELAAREMRFPEEGF